MKKILIWGTGTIAKELIDNSVNGEIIGFVETHKTKKEFKGVPVYSVDELPNCYDYIIVANTYASEIYTTCLQKGINLEKMIFLCGFSGLTKRVGFLNLSDIKRILGEKNYTNYCIEFRLIENSFFQSDLEKYNALNNRPSFNVEEQYLYPIIQDKYAKAGYIGKYFWQDLWAAKLIIKSGVKEHLDIGSRIDGFIAHLLAANIKVTVIDIREFPTDVENLHTIIDDATSLKQIADESIDSMSALCSLEHFGLGRYGDPIDPEACFKCFNEIQKKVKKGGSLYISVPIGKERVEFNAHRVFYASTIIKQFHQLELAEFSCTTAEQIEYDVEINKYDCDQSDGDHRYGLFHFIKL